MCTPLVYPDGGIIVLVVLTGIIEERCQSRSMNLHQGRIPPRVEADSGIAEAVLLIGQGAARIVDLQPAEAIATD